MKKMMTALIVLASVQAFAKNPVCTVESADAPKVSYGSFEVAKYEGGIQYGQLQNNINDMASTPKATGYVQVSVSKESAKAPYEVTYWVTNKDRKAEATTTLLVKSLPVEAKIKLQGNNNTSTAIAEESVAEVVITCK